MAHMSVARKLFKLTLFVGLTACLADRVNVEVFSGMDSLVTAQDCSAAKKTLIRLQEYLPKKIEKLMTKTSSRITTMARIIKLARNAKTFTTTMAFVEANRCLKTDELDDLKRNSVKIQAEIKLYAEQLAAGSNGELQLGSLLEAIATAEAKQNPLYERPDVMTVGFLKQVNTGRQLTKEERLSWTKAPDPDISKAYEVAKIGSQEGGEEPDEKDDEMVTTGLLEVSEHDGQGFRGKGLLTSSSVVDVLKGISKFFGNAVILAVLSVIGIVWYCLFTFAYGVAYPLALGWLFVSLLACGIFWVIASLGTLFKSITNFYYNGLNDFYDSSFDEDTRKCWFTGFVQPVEAGTKALDWGFSHNPITMDFIDYATSILLQQSEAAGVVANMTSIMGAAAAAATTHYAIGQ